MRRGIIILLRILVCWIILNCVLVGTGFLVIRPSPDAMMATQRKAHYTRKTRAASSDYFVFSVIAINTTENENYDVFAVNTWKVNLESDADDIYCCYLVRGGKTIVLRHSGINQRKEMFNLTAQVECPNPTITHEFDHLKVVGVTLSAKQSCTYDNNFVIPYYPLKQTKKFNFAVCGKIIYGDVNIALTVEWMEYNKYMGVNKVVLYPYNLSNNGTKLLRYYRSIGFADVIQFDTPPNTDTATYRPGMKTTEAWNLEQMIVYDCQSRLRGFKYVAVLDLDEFIVPVTDKNFEGMMNKLMYLLPSMSAAEVYGEMFILDWQPTYKGGNMVIAQYQNRTVSKSPVDINQRKLIHIPDRVQRGSVVTHGCKALNTSYHIFKDPLSIMTINHYRKCVHFRDDCLTRARVMDKRISRFSSKIELYVRKAKQKMNIL